MPSSGCSAIATTATVSVLKSECESCCIIRFNVGLSSLLAWEPHRTMLYVCAPNQEVACNAVLVSSSLTSRIISVSSITASQMSAKNDSQLLCNKDVNELHQFFRVKFHTVLISGQDFILGFKGVLRRFPADCGLVKLLDDIRISEILVGGGSCWQSRHILFLSSKNRAVITRSLSAFNFRGIFEGTEFERTMVRSPKSTTCIFCACIA